jgi:hypothetical protein
MTIDYDKLKIAHELAKEYANSSGDSIVIEHNCCFGCYVNVPCQMIINQAPRKFDSIDDLISKLTELTQPRCKCGNKLDVERSICNECIDKALKSCKPKPKYEVGSRMWYVNCDDEIESFIVDRHSIDAGEFIYEDKDRYSWLVEKQLYTSREALIEAQIDYWQNLLSEELEQHVSDYCKRL